MINQQVVMTVRRWKRYARENVERETARTTTWAEICYWSQRARLDALGVAWRELSELNGLLLTEWRSKSFRFLSRKPIKYSNAVEVGTWASAIVDEYLKNSGSKHLVRIDDDLVAVYIDDTSLPEKLQMVSLDDQEAAAAFEKHIHNLIEQGGLRDSDKLTLPLVTARYFRIPFGEKDIVEITFNAEEE